MSSRSTTNSERTLIIGVVTTSLSLIPTAYAALISNSVVLYGDLFRCIAEWGAIVLSWLILRRVNRSDRAQFHYGFGKLEQLSGASVGLALLFASFVIGGAAVFRGISPQPITGGEFGLYLGILSVTGNMAMSWHYARLNRANPTPVLSSQLKLFSAKTLVSVVVTLTLVVGVYLPGTTISLLADPLGSTALAIFLARSAYHLLSASMKDLIDCSVEEALQLAVLRTLIEHESLYAGLNEIRTRRAGRTVYLEILLEFENHLEFGKIRERVRDLTKAVKDKIPEAEVLVIPV